MADKKSSLDRYKDKNKRINYVDAYNKERYKRVLLTLSYTNDKEMLEELEAASNKSELVREWYRKAKES